MKKTLLPLLATLLFFTLACSLVTGSPISEQPVPNQLPVDQEQAPAAPQEVPPEQAPAAESNTLFQDDFSDTNSGWDSADWESGITDYSNGAYRMLVKVPSYVVWANPGEYFDGDTITEVDATKVSGEDDNRYGLICRYSGTPEMPNYYFFLISSDGYAVIGKTVEGDSEFISSEEMQPVEAIYQGATTNHVRADCIGNSLSFYVNGQQVAVATDSAYTGGDTGLITGTFEIESTEITFDNLVVKRP